MSPVKSPEERTPPDVGKTDKIVADKEEAGELPPGWTKEVKIRKSGSGRKKVDRLYTDPVTGYRFRSLKDVQRYLKTGEIGRLAVKPKDECGREERTESTEQVSENLKQKRTPSTDKSELPEHAAKRLSEIHIAAVLPPPVSLSQPKTRRATRLAGLAVDAAAPETPHQAGIKIVSPPLASNSKTHQATPLSGIEIGPSPPSQPEPKTRQAKRVLGIRDNASLASPPPQPKTRRAKQEAGIKINSPPDTRRISPQATRTRPDNSAATPKENGKKKEVEKITDQEDSITILPPVNQESNKKQKIQSISPPPVTPPKEHNKPIESRPTTLPPPHEDQALPPTIVPSVNTEKQESSNQIPGYGGDMKPDSCFNFSSVNDLWTDPCIEFAVKTLTGAIPVRDMNKVENFTAAPLEVPLEELWTDPCIEFAIKTLTGAIPVGEDDHLPHRPATSSTNSQGAQHLFSPPGMLTKHYEIGHRNKQQQDPVVFPTLGNNGGLQKSGKFVNNGTPGQSSRSRFFQ